MLSLAEENYLKAIYHLSQGGAKSVLTNELAEAMNTKAASVTDMIKKLAGKQLLSYEKYHGVNISSLGKASALMVVRKHRLWETFLVQKLGFQWDEVHEVAEQLEHIQSNRLIDKLDEFLGYPTTDPHGEVIPDQKGRITSRAYEALDRQAAGYDGVIDSVRDSGSELLKYLDKIGAHPGIPIKVLRKEHFDDSMEVLIRDKKVFVSKEVSKNIMVAV